MSQVTGEWLEPTRPTLSEQVAILAIEQSKAVWEQRLDDSKRLAEQMIAIIKAGIAEQEA